MRPITLSFLLAAAVGLAAPVTYNSLSSWQAAGPQNAGTITFDGIASGQVSSPLLITGWSFSSTSASNMLMYGSPIGSTDLGAGPSLTSAQNPGGIQITPPSGVYAIGFLTGIWGSGSNQITVFINGVQVYADASNTPLTANILAAAPVFWGFRNDVEITSLVIAAAGSGNRINIDSVVSGGQGTPPPPETPEAATAILIGSALLLMPSLKRRLGALGPQQPFAH